MAAIDPTSSQLIRFGLYEVDLTARELRRDGAIVKLQDRPFEVLAVLIERPGDVITRDEFRRRLWSADTFVDFDASLNTSVNKLRQALSDSAENPRFIATAGRRGYRFIAPASAVKADAVVAEALPLAPLPTSITSVPAIKAKRRGWTHALLGISAIALAAAMIVDAFRPDPVPKVLSIVQISHDGLLDPWGKLTTDGARVFYLGRAGGHWNLMQAPASGGEAQPFLEPSQNIRVVGISPDRSQLLTFAFHGRSNDLPLSLTPVVGGPPRRVGNIVADDAVFSPDGRRIFFNRPDGIYSTALDGSQMQRLVALSSRSEDPQWSKDGQRLRFTLDEPDPEKSSIWEVSANGSNLHPVNLNLPTPGSVCCGRWSTNGRYFLFTFVHDGIQSIWAIRDGARRWLSRAARPVPLTFGPDNYGGLITNEDPTRIYAWSGAEQSEIDRYNPASGRLQPLLPGIGSGAVMLSPDGASAAYASGGELWRSGPDGSRRQPLVSGLPPIDGIEWSSDAKRIFFHTTEKPKSDRFFLVSADGGPATEVPLGTGRTEASWASDSESIVFAKWATDSQATLAASGIYLLNLLTSKVSKIPGSEGLVHPIFSPDRRFLAAITNFDLNPTQPTRVMLFDSQTQAWHEIAHGTLVNPVQWSKDSKYLYYQDILGEGQPSFRFSITANRSEPFIAFDNLLNAGYARCSFGGFAPDGTPIVYLRRNEVNVYRLDLDLP
jgi:DNA-binding winged helix-turn-helix (wHTH) protein/Tol biopolymer transport system component